MNNFAGKHAKILFVNLFIGVSNVLVDHLNPLMEAPVLHLCLLMAAPVVQVLSQSIPETLSVHLPAIRSQDPPQQILFQ